MLSEKETKLLKHLRENSRESLTSISAKTGIPVSTLFDVLKKLESGVIIKHVPLLDFSKIGYNIRVNFAINSKNNSKMREFLANHRNVNSLSSLIDNNFSIFAECLFKNLKEMSDFKDSLSRFEVTNISENFIVEELKKEDFQL